MHCGSRSSENSVNSSNFESCTRSATMLMKIRASQCSANNLVRFWVSLKSYSTKSLSAWLCMFSLTHKVLLTSVTYPKIWKRSSARTARRLSRTISPFSLRTVVQSASSSSHSLLSRSYGTSTEVSVKKTLSSTSPKLRQTNSVRQKLTSSLKMQVNCKKQ